MRVGTQYFLVRIPKDEQKYKRENIGSLFLHPNLAFFSRNSQCGEIVSIGEMAQKNFPEAKVGYIVIMHHFVEGSLDKRSHRSSQVMEDGSFKYYVVSGIELPGTRVQSYGVWNGSKIIPHKDYIFLEKDLPEIEKESSDIFVQPEYVESTERTLSDLKKLKKYSLALAKNKMNEDKRAAIEKKDKMRERITNNFHKQEHKMYAVAYSSDSTISSFVYSLNVASNTIIDFLGKEYRIVETKYLSITI